MDKIGVVNARFQVLHLKHMEYILAAKMRCDKLLIGITNPDSLHTHLSQYDLNRSTKAYNPLTYYERVQMIHLGMKEFNVPLDKYEIIPFPINTPEYILSYAPKNGKYYMNIFDMWDEEKFAILKSLGLDVEVFSRKSSEEKGITGEKVRRLIALDEPWEEYVPKAVYKYLTANGLSERIKRLEQIRMEEKSQVIKDEED
ncbi:MAG: nicotinate-nucleotide adenylyltransferase [Lachnospiraceae bacterium]|jgi:nicotinamide mononucleotide adenylyltransferase|nr:nicotinate-nucleotide adenylyltransferase [Lachnospiraceae bacterium]